MTRRFLFLLPIVVFAALIGFFAYRLILIARGNMPDLLPSAMIGKPVPVFDLPPLFAGKAGLKTADLKGKVTIINFFASWCVPCHAEHSGLAGIAGKGAMLTGIDYKDHAAAVKSWFAKSGDPYDIVAADADGSTALNFGLYGVPETYVVDKQGIIRFRQAGPLTPRIIRDQLLPLIKELNQ